MNEGQKFFNEFYSKLKKCNFCGREDQANYMIIHALYKMNKDGDRVFDRYIPARKCRECLEDDQTNLEDPPV